MYIAGLPNTRVNISIYDLFNDKSVHMYTSLSYTYNKYNLNLQCYQNTILT